MGSFDVSMVSTLPGSWINHVDADVIDFEKDEDKQCIEINALFSGELMLFQQFCCSSVGRYQQVQAHLCIRATTFYALPVPLPRQVSKIFQVGV